MGARAILSEMAELLRVQTEAMVAGDHEAVFAGAMRHEQLLRELETADLDAPPDEIRSLVEAMDVDKAKLQSLLTSESARVDFLLRLLLGGKTPRPGGYPAGKWQHGTRTSRMNQRT